MDRSKGKRKVIRRLDFENCEVTTVKLRKKFRKRLKAKITNEYEDDNCGSPDPQTDHSEKVSDANQQGSTAKDEYSSPILFRKCSSQKRIPDTPSPVLLTKQTGKRSALRKKRRMLQSQESQASTSASGGNQSPTSPILVVKSAASKKKRFIANEAAAMHEERITRDGNQIEATKNDDTPSRYISNERFIEDFTKVPILSGLQPGIENSELLIDDDDRGGVVVNEYEIEDFSQEFSQEAKTESAQELKISSYSSESRALSELIISQDESRDTFPSNEDKIRTPGKNEEDADETSETSNSDKKRKRYKRGGLAVRLINLRKRKESERRIREHESRIMKTGEKWKKTLHVVESWKEGTRLTLKCQQLDVAGDSSTVTAASESFYVILDKNVGSVFNKIGEGAFLRIAPPWQELRLRTINSSVLLSVTSLELIDKIPGVTLPTTGMHRVPISKYKEDEASFFDALLNSETNVFLR